jgi:hypothetical protein
VRDILFTDIGRKLLCVILPEEIRRNSVAVKEGYVNLYLREAYIGKSS